MNASNRRPVVVAGHVCVDLHPRFEGEIAIQPGMLFEVGPLDVRSGGCVANTGLDLAALGSPVRLFADVGNDELGRMLRDVVRGPNIDPTGIRSVTGAETSYSIVIQAAGADRSFWHHVGANQRYDGTSVEMDGSDLMHLGYPTILPALYSDDGRGLVELLKRARTAGVTTSVDLSTVSPSSPSARADWETILDRALPQIDIFDPSLDDVLSILPQSSGTGPSDIARLGSSLIERGAGVVLLKSGRSGLYLRTAGVDRLSAGGRALEPVADRWADRELWAPSIEVGVHGTTGAGDAASAGLLHAVDSGLDPASSIALAAAAAALRISDPGPLPNSDELRSRIGRDLSFRSFEAPGWTPTDDGLAIGPSDRSDQEVSR